MIKAKTEKLFKTLFTFSIVFFVSSIGIKFYLCNSMTIRNSEFEQAFLQKEGLEEEIENLKVENCSLSSISFLESKSRELGFVEMSEHLISIDLDSPIQVALVSSN